MTKQFLKWPGGKSKLISQYKPYLPSQPLPVGNYYVEPFLGSGAVFFYLHSKKFVQSAQCILSDINPWLINTYLVVRDYLDPLLILLQDYHDTFSLLDKEGRKRYYYQQRNHFNELRDLIPSRSIELAALFIFLNRTNFNSLMRFAKNGTFNSPVGRYANPLICNQNGLRKANIALQGVDIRCGSFRETLSTDLMVEGNWIFNDPPYLRIESAKRSFVAYSKDGFSMQDQADLASRCRELALAGAQVWICNAETLTTLALYHGFEIYPIDAKRNINSKVSGRGEVREILAVTPKKW